MKLAWSLTVDAAIPDECLQHRGALTNPARDRRAAMAMPAAHDWH